MACALEDLHLAGLLRARFRVSSTRRTWSIGIILSVSPKKQRTGHWRRSARLIGARRGVGANATAVEGDGHLDGGGVATGGEERDRAAHTEPGHAQRSPRTSGRFFR